MKTPSSEPPESSTPAAPAFEPSRHRTHRESLWRFLALVLVLVGYFVYLSWKFDAASGAWLALLSWSFFVLCTPVADGGFIVAFPVRLLLGARMWTTQLVVWILAIVINAAALAWAPEKYAETELTRLLHTILTTPWPDWSILVISAAGTGLSIWFGDEMMDVTTHADRTLHHRHGFKHKGVIIAGLVVLALLAYSRLLRDLGMVVPS